MLKWNARLFSLFYLRISFFLSPLPTRRRCLLFFFISSFLHHVSQSFFLTFFLYFLYFFPAFLLYDISAFYFFLFKLKRKQKASRLFSFSLFLFRLFLAKRKKIRNASRAADFCPYSGGGEAAKTQEPKGVSLFPYLNWSGLTFCSFHEDVKKKKRKRKS